MKEERKKERKNKDIRKKEVKKERSEKFLTRRSQILPFLQIYENPCVMNLTLLKSAGAKTIWLLTWRELES